MPLSQPEDVLAALNEGKPYRLIGAPENPQIDFRSQPYALDTSKGMWELARDVADLANHSGGVILIGVRPARSEGSFVEVATELQPVPASMLNVDRYCSIIREQVRPSVEFDVAYFQASHHAHRGYMSIHVKPLARIGRRATVRQPWARFWPLGAASRAR